MRAVWLWRQALCLPSLTRKLNAQMPATASGKDEPPAKGSTPWGALRLDLHGVLRRGTISVVDVRLVVARLARWSAQPVAVPVVKQPTVATMARHVQKRQGASTAWWHETTAVPSAGPTEATEGCCSGTYTHGATRGGLLLRAQGAPGSARDRPPGAAGAAWAPPPTDSV